MSTTDYRMGGSGRSAFSMLIEELLPRYRQKLPYPKFIWSVTFLMSRLGHGLGSRDEPNGFVEQTCWSYMVHILLIPLVP